MGRMSRFLRFCAFLSVLFFTTNVFAAGYSCPTYKKYTSCSAGYYMTNSSGTYNGTPAVGNLCTICPKGYYCTGGTANKVACSAGRYGSSTGLRTSACSGVIAAGRYGSAGATSSNGSGAVSAGYYSSGGGTSATPTAAGNGCLSGYKCGKVSTGCYGSAGATTDCPNSCPAGYQAGAGTTAQSNCLASCAAGSRVATANAACTAITSGNVYMPAHMVKYGQISEEPKSCPSSYTISGTTQADHDAKEDCKITCSAGTRVTTADATCSSISSSTGYYITSHTVSAGSVSPAATQCPENYRTGAGTTSQSNCLASCSAGYAVLTANSACATIQNSTYMGKYTTAHTVKYGDTSTISTCPTNYQTGNGTTAQSNCLASCAAGYAVLTENSACTTIQNSTYMGKYTTAHVVKYGDTSTISTCPGGYRDGAGTTAQSNCLASCAAGSRVVTANEACSAITSGNVYMLAHTVKYGETSAAATSCPSSYTISGTTQADHDAKADCKISCNAGYAVLTADATCSTIQNSTYKGKYTASHTVSAGSTSTISTCPANYQTGNGAAGQANCTTSCAAGSRVATANEACSAITSGNVYMLAHTVKYGATSAAATSCPSSYTISGTTQADHDAKDDCKITCSAGTRVTTADATCSSISSSTGYYITSHTVSAGSTSPAATQCPENYRSGAGTTAQSNCLASCAAGSRVATANEACSAITSGNVYMLAHTVNYGSTSAAATSCPSSYTISGTTQADHDAKADCKITCSAGTRVTTADATCSSISDSTGYYITSHTVSAGSTSPAATQCPENYRSGAGTTSEANCSLTTTAGKYVATAGAGETACISPYYCPGGATIKYGTGTTTGGNSACTALGAIYSKSDAGASAGTNCYATTTSTKWVASAKASSESTCTAGYYCAGGTKVYYNSTGGRTACGGGKYSAEGATSCSNITAGCYGTSASSECPAVCAANTYSNAGASACTACDSDYANSGDTAASHAGVASCKVTCAAGTYVASSGAACTDVGSGYYTTASQTISQGSTGSRSACSSLNAFYTASDGGRDATTDCFGTTTSGKFVKTAKSGEETCTAGGYCAGSVKVYYNSTGGRTGCGAGKYNASTGSSSSSACANITAGCYGTSASSECPAVCAADTYSNAGASSCTSCPTDYKNSGDTATAHAGSASCIITVSGGYYIGTAGDNSSNWDKCSAGYYKAAHSVAYGSTSSCSACGAVNKYSAAGASACSTVSTGYYTTGGTTTTRTGQSQCTSGTYCTGGVQNTCPSGYGASAAGSDAAADCYMSVAATKYVKAANDSSASACGTGTYKAAHTVYYGGTSTCNSCPSGYDDGAAVATQAECVISVAGGKYVGTANSATLSTCAGGTYKASHTVAYGSTSSCGTCPANSYCPAGASAATACSTLASGFYPNSAAGSDAAADCYTNSISGKYVASANATSATSCAGGTYKGAHQVNYGSTSSCGQCPANSYCPAGASAATACSTLASGFYPNSAAGSDAATDCYTNSLSGKYVASANATSATTCSCGTYKAAHTVAYGSTSSCTTTNAGYYAAEGASSQTQASAGYYAAAGACEQTVLNNGCYGSAGASTACPNNCNALTAPAVTGGTFSSVTPRSANTACRYVAPSKTDAECTSITANTVSYSGTAWGTNFYTAKANKGSYVSATGNTAAPACTTCSKGYYQASDSSTAASCTPADKGYYVDTTGASAQKQCTAGTYTSSTAQSGCSTITSGCWGAAGATSACPNNCNALTAPAVTGGTFSSVTPRSANTACRYVAPSKTYTGCSSITANTVSYSGTAWGTDFYMTKASKGYRVTATGNTSAPACTACACGTYQGTDGSTTTTCTTTSAGYYAKGTGNSSQTQADAGYYAAAGACDQTKIQAGCFGGEGSASACPNSCPAAESGWTLASTTGLTVVTDCAEITTPSTSGSPIATICTAGTLTKKATNSTTWGSATASGLTAKAGRYVNGTTCSACAAGTYTSSATTATSCTPAAAGYYVSGTEATSQTACPAGTYGSTTGLTSSACSGKCTAGYYCPAASTSATQNECTAGNYCPAGAGAETSCATVGGKLYVNSAAKSDAATDCYISLASKVYLASATSTSTTTCTAGYYCPGGNFYYSSSATNQGRSSCTGTTYSGSGAASCSDCPSGYTANTSNNKTAASQCQISCAAGTQVATANAQCTTPGGNWYTTASQLVNYGSTSSVNACKVATNLFNPSDYDSLWGFITSSRTTVGAYDVNAIVWVPVEPNTTYIVSGMRGANTMTVANSASVPAIGVEFSNFVDPGSVGKGMLYTTSSNAKYLILQGLRDADRATTSTRQSVLDKNVANLQIFKASDGYGIIGNATTDHDTAEDCKITCGPGQYVATENSACVNVGAGYYAAGGSVSYGSTSTNRSQCASGLTTIGYGTGANEAADCGRKLHAGDNVIYLRSAERTSPSLRVKVGDKTFFGALSTALSGALKVKNGSTTYSVVNDWQ